MSKTAIKNVACTACVMALIGITPAHANKRITSYVPSAQKVGEGRLTYLFWDVYDATLYAPEGSWKEGKPFALKLSYLRAIEGKQIADRSAEEIRNQGINDEQDRNMAYTNAEDIPGR